MNQTRATYTVPEAAKILGIGRNSAYEAARTGAIPTLRIGKRLLVPISALNKLLLEHRISGYSEAGKQL